MNKSLVTYPNLLYFCDFPPSNLRGGAVLLSRLLGNYPAENITILTGSYFDKLSPAEGRLSCEQLLFPTSNETGRWGLGRIKSLFQWLLILPLAVYAGWVAKNRKSRLILTVAHGHFFVAAALASLFTSLPLILFVHDDWVAELRRTSFIMKYLGKIFFRFVAGRSSYIYTVTPYMQEMLKREYGVSSEVQLPAIEPGCAKDFSSVEEGNPECLKLFYAGTGTCATEDSFNMLLHLVKSTKLLDYGIKSWELHLFTLATPLDVKMYGWEHERIKFHGWVSQERLRQELLKADILFLPFSFKEEQRYATEQAFPSKTADYLASGKPILIFAPPFSSVVKYGRQYGFAEIVVEASEEKLAKAIAKLWNSPKYRETLRINARRTLESNHNINTQSLDFQKLVINLANNGGRNISKVAANA